MSKTNFVPFKRSISTHSRSSCVQAFVQKLEYLCEANGSFLVPCLEAFATLCLDKELQVRCICQFLCTLPGS